MNSPAIETDGLRTPVGGITGESSTRDRIDATCLEGVFMSTAHSPNKTCMKLGRQFFIDMANTTVRLPADDHDTATHIWMIPVNIMHISATETRPPVCDRDCSEA